MFEHLQPHRATSMAEDSGHVLNSRPATGISHLENVDMDVGHREHRSAYKHAE